MATYNASGFVSVATTAGYDALMAAIHSHIISFGWIQTTDTGQTDPSAVTVPSVSTTSGYCVYKTNDSLTTLYMRIDYYRGNNTEPRLKIQVGYGTDGAGTITGQKCTQIDIHPSENGGSGALAMSGDTGRISLMWGTTWVATQQMCFAVERDRDSTGAEVSTGFNIYSSTGSSVTQQFVPSSGTIPTQQTAIIVAHPSSTTTAVTGANTLFSAPIPIKETGGGNPGIACLVYTGTDFTVNTTTVLSLYSVSHTYFVMAQTAGIYGSSSFHTMWRYE